MSNFSLLPEDPLKEGKGVCWLSAPGDTVIMVEKARWQWHVRSPEAEGDNAVPLL